MGVMAILTGRCSYGSSPDRLTVHAGSVTGSLAGVTAHALDRFQGPVVIGMLGGDVCVTTHATIGVVDGGRQFGAIDEEGASSAEGVGDYQRLVGMAIQAITVLESRRRQSAQRIP